MLETDVRTLLGLMIVDSNPANSCFVAMSWSSIADIEFARGFSASIVVFCALLDEVLMQPLECLVDLECTIGPSMTAAVPVTAVVSPAAIVTASLISVWLWVFLAFLVRPMMRDVKSRLGKLKVQDRSSRTARDSYRED